MMPTHEEDYRGGGVIAATFFGLLLPICVVAIREWVKSRTEATLTTRIEDWLARGALVFKVALDVSGIILLVNGLGSHVSTVPPAQLVTFAKTQYAGNYLYTACIACIKLSILCQYHRILGPTARPYFRWLVRTLMGIVICWVLCIFMLSIAICIPLDKFWNPKKPGGCLDIKAFYYGLQIPNIVTDLLIVVCPTYNVYKQYSSHIHSSKHAKSSMRAAIYIMFSLGLLTLIFDIVRLTVFLDINPMSSDTTYDLVDPAIWTTIEPAIAIVAICLPSVRKAYLMIRQHMKGYSGGQELEEPASENFGSQAGTDISWTPKGREVSIADQSRV